MRHQSSQRVLLFGAIALTAFVSTGAAQRVAGEALPRSKYGEPWEPPADFVDLEIDADGTLALDQKVYDLHGIASLLMTRNDAEDFGDEVETRTGKRRFRTTPVLLRAHRDTPAVAVAELIRNLGVRRIAYWKIHVAVQDNRVLPLYQPRGLPRDHHTLRLAHAADRATPADLDEKLAAAATPWSRMPVFVRVGPAVRWGDAIRSLERVIAAGFTTMHFIGEPGSAQGRAFRSGRGRDLAALVAASPTASTPLALQFTSFEPAIANQRWNMGLGGHPPTPTALRIPDERAVIRPARAASKRAIAWLISQQGEDGTWSTDPGREITPAGAPRLTHVGLAGLVALALRADGSTLRQGPHKAEYRRAILALRKLRRDEATRGKPAGAAPQTALDRALLALALVDAQYSSSYKLLKKDAVAALSTLHATDELDPVTQAVWLQAAIIADFADLPGGAEALEIAGRKIAATPRDPVSTIGASVFVDQVMQREVADDDPRITALLTAAAAAKAAETDAATLTPADWLFGTDALYRLGDEPWQKWRSALAEVVLPRESRGPEVAGSWQFDGSGLDRTVGTVMLSLTLMPHERFPPR